MSDTELALGIYNPNGPAAIVAFLAYGAVDVWLWIRYFRTRPRPKYMLYACISCLFMSIGFLIRFTRRNGINAWSFLGETICLLISPCIFVAQLYVLLPRLAIELGREDCHVFSRRTIVHLFLWADVISVMAQLAGTGLQATFGYLIGIGIKTVAGGLGAQLLFFSGFLYVFTIFGKRLRGEYAEVWSTQPFSRYFLKSHWKVVYWMIAGDGACMMVRCLYRVIEYASGSRAISDSEVAFYVFDCVPMLSFITLIAIVWPPRHLETIKDDAYM